MDLDALLLPIESQSRRGRTGRVADYIPELAAANSADFGIAICAMSGQIGGAGQHEEKFTIQSVCKPLLYAAALEKFGGKQVHSRVGVEPTGQEFNAYTRLESNTGRPSNPLINPGAIAITDMLLSERLMHGDTVIKAQHRFVELIAGFIGRPGLVVNEAVFESEQRHASRNRVIAYLMKHFSMITGNVEDVLSCYFRICALEVSCRDLACAAACLAAGGKNPVTNQRVVSEKVVQSVLTLMATCGTYDASGRFALDVGIPSKSGVSGAIMSAIPGRFGVAVRSPGLDPAGNSVRGWSALRRLQTRLGCHVFDTLKNAEQQAGTIQSCLEQIQSDVINEICGSVAAYLPVTNPDEFAIAVCTSAGEEFAVGNADLEFSLQAVANPLSYALALKKFKFAAVRRLTGVEPSGNPFHAILIDQRTGRPYNPLGNAGAIAIAGLHQSRHSSGQCSWLDELSRLGEFAEPLTYDSTVLEAEYSSGDRNRAIANLLQEFGVINDVDGALDQYFLQCASMVTCRKLARIGSTLARGGIPAGTNHRQLTGRIVREVLTVMYNCGMHDQSGQFALDVGMPAKSGISGVILAVVPGGLAVAAYSPRVDDAGTSIRGRAALVRLAAELCQSVFRRECR